ncbi:dienelactone hydrolase family protein [Ferrovibrio sp.]|uniref:dienelactone hydrolase family protein n=1 Tax=Ferrovibrio sp. TaxID=1917215 RepID=UPI002630D2AD|nr:dienelactone hydrolase family protein [Ferrovibrio sp.]
METPLARVWSATKIVFPAEPDNFFYRPGFTLDRAIAEHRPKSVPAVVYLHDCAGIAVASPEMRIISGLARAGFVVFAPHSLDRPRDAFCTDARDYHANAEDVAQRLAELEYVREQLRQFPWLDQANVFAVGHGLGGWALTQLSVSTFPVVTITGVNCLPAESASLKSGIAAPEDVAVLTLLGSHDETLAVNLHERNCSIFPEMQRVNRKSVLLPGVGHDITRDPAAVPLIVDFLKLRMVRPTRTVRK